MKLPEEICTGCIKELEQAHGFKKKYEAAIAKIAIDGDETEVDSDTSMEMDTNTTDHPQTVRKSNRKTIENDDEVTTFIIDSD